MISLINSGPKDSFKYGFKNMSNPHRYPAQEALMKFINVPKVESTILLTLRLINAPLLKQLLS